MSPSQAERIARVAERKRPDRPAPWHLELRGTQHTLFADDVTVAALAQGLVTARLQCQAAMIARYIEEPEESAEMTGRATALGQPVRER